MLRVVCLCSLAAAAVVVLRWLIRGVDALGRRRSFPAISLGLSLTLAAATGIPVLRHAAFERRLAEVASSLVGMKVSVDCQTLSQAWTSAHAEAGYVRFDADDRPEPVATITVDTCDDLQAWAGSDHENPSLPQVIAVHVLTHESMHMAGHRDEAVAECAAVQRDARTAVLLGADPTQARALARRYWQQVYPRIPDAYRTANCASDAPLDEHTADAPWASAGTA